MFTNSVWQLYLMHTIFSVYVSDNWMLPWILSFQKAISAEKKSQNKSCFP